MATLPAVLCLHGKHQDAEIFSQRLRTLAKKVGGAVRLDFMDAPIELPLREGDEVAMRTWWDHSGADAGEHDIDGVLNAVALVKQRLASAAEPHIGVLGFSQGAALGMYLFRALKQHEFPELRFGIFAGGWVRQHVALNTIASTWERAPYTLHFAGVRDALILPKDSRRAADLFPKGGRTTYVEHDGGHAFPQSAECVAAVRQFLAGVAPAGGTAPAYPLPEELVEELEGLEMLYADDIKFATLTSVEGGAVEGALDAWRDAAGAGADTRYTAPPSIAIRMDEHEVTVRLTFFPGYPEAMPIKVDYDFDPLAVGEAPPPSRPQKPWFRWAARELAALAEENAGEPMAFAVLEKVKELLEGGNDGVPTDVAVDTTADADGTQKLPASPQHVDPVADAPRPPCPMVETEDQRAEHAELASEFVANLEVTDADWAEASRKSGRFRYTIGLVGKPSAGKSTFFNAATQDATAARVAAFPFTTIEPNVGDAYCGIPCPCQDPRNGIAPGGCGAADGHAVSGERFFPITVRDVAGLVPGAYQGRGKGNRFLDDLNDADVLVHVVDASGMTDAEGQAREEEAAGGDAKKAEEAKEGDGLDAISKDVLHEVRWVRREIHQWIYTNVTRKWDTIIRRPEKLPIMFTGYHASEGMVHLAARKVGIDAQKMGAPGTWSALLLHKLVAGFIKIRFPVVLAMNKSDQPTAARHVRAVREAFPNETIRTVSSQVETTLIRLREEGVIRYQVGGDVAVVDGQAAKYPQAVREYLAGHGGSSGVSSVLSAAVSLRPTIRCYPVVEPTTLVSYGGEVLAHCFHLIPGSTPYDLYRILAHGHFVEGDFVRATTVDPAARVETIIKKETPLQHGVVARVMTNRKSKWQQGFKGRQGQ